MKRQSLKMLIFLLTGAGIFVDHVLITENTVDGKQFVFYINKWFDSGQV